MSTQTTKKNSKIRNNRKTFTIVLIALLIIILAVGLVIYNSVKQKDDVPASNNATTNSVESNPTQTPATPAAPSLVTPPVKGE